MSEPAGGELLEATPADVAEIFGGEIMTRGEFTKTHAKSPNGEKSRLKVITTATIHEIAEEIQGDSHPAHRAASLGVRWRGR